jgi:hypothetical protein
MVEFTKPVPFTKEHTPREARWGIDCVVLTCFEPEKDFWANLFPSVGIRMHGAKSLPEADFALTVTGATVVLMDIVFPDGS